MTTTHIDTRTFAIRLPSFVATAPSTSIALHVTEQIELRIERRTSAQARQARQARRAQHAVVRAEVDARRTQALAQRLGTL